MLPGSTVAPRRPDGRTVTNPATKPKEKMRRNLRDAQTESLSSSLRPDHGKSTPPCPAVPKPQRRACWGRHKRARRSAPSPCTLCRWPVANPRAPGSGVWCNPNHSTRRCCAVSGACIRKSHRKTVSNAQNVRCCATERHKIVFLRRPTCPLGVPRAGSPRSSSVPSPQTGKQRKKQK